jgi:hypothetical protein
MTRKEAEEKGLTDDQLEKILYWDNVSCSCQVDNFNREWKGRFFLEDSYGEFFLYKYDTQLSYIQRKIKEFLENE